MQKFFLFVISGIMIYGINIGFTYFQVNILLFSESLSYLFSLLLSMLFGLWFSFRYTFKVKFSKTILKKYLLAVITLTTLNYIGVQICTALISKQYFYIFIFTITTIIFFLKFFVYDRFVFTSSK